MLSLARTQAWASSVAGGGRFRLLGRLSPLCSHLSRDALASAVLQIDSFSEMLARGDASDMGVQGNTLLQGLAEQIRCMQER